MEEIKNTSIINGDTLWINKADYDNQWISVNYVDGKIYVEGREVTSKVIRVAKAIKVDGE